MNRRLGEHIRAHPNLAKGEFAGVQHRFIQRMIGPPDPTGALSPAQLCYTLRLVADEDGKDEVRNGYDTIEKFVRLNDHERIERVTRRATKALTHGERYEAVATLCEGLSHMRVAPASALLAWSCAVDLPILGPAHWQVYRWLCGSERDDRDEGSSEIAMGTKRDYLNFEPYERDLAGFVSSVDNPSFTAFEVSDWMQHFAVGWLSVVQGRQEGRAA